MLTSKELLEYKPADNLLANKVILVTGAGSGLGRDIAKGCAASGATVVLLGRTTKKLELVYDQILADGHPEPAIYPMNLEGASWKDYEDLAATLEREFGRLDGLVHNAVFFDNLRPMNETSAPLWLKSLHVNLNAPMFMTQVCLPLLENTGESSVLFLTDSAGSEAKAFWGPYAVAKSGIDTLSHLWSRELANSAIRMNSLDPGPVKSQLHELAYPAAATNSYREASAVVPACLYLLGADSIGVTGQRLMIDPPQ